MVIKFMLADGWDILWFKESLNWRILERKWRILEQFGDRLKESWERMKNSWGWLKDSWGWLRITENDCRILDDDCRFLDDDWRILDDDERILDDDGRILDHNLIFDDPLMILEEDSLGKSYLPTTESREETFKQNVWFSKKCDVLFLCEANPGILYLNFCICPLLEM